MKGGGISVLAEGMASPSLPHEEQHCSLKAAKMVAIELGVSVES